MFVIANGKDVDYSIHYFDKQNLLIAHMRYIGDEYEKDMAAIGEDEHTRRWWKVSSACFSLGLKQRL